MKFDDILQETAGDFGRWQKFLTLFLGFYGCCGCFIVWDTVFTAAHQASWCHVAHQPRLQGDRLSPTELDNLTIPWQYHNGVWRPDPCHMYSYNMSDSTELAPGNDISVTSSPEVVAFSKSPLLNYTKRGAVNVSLGRNVSLTSCVKYDYDTSQFKSTIISEWDLVCGASYLVAVTRSVAMAGLMLGSGLGGYLSDRFGRRRTAVITIPLAVIGKLGVSLSPNLIFYNICNFITIASSSVAYLAIFTLGVELVGPSRRAVVGTILCEAYAVGYLILTLMGYLIRSWRILSGSVTAVISLSLGFLCIMPESPRWLLSRGEETEAMLILRRLARLNGRTPPKSMTLKYETNETIGQDQIWHLFSSKPLLSRFFLIFIAWFTAAVTYYGLTLDLGSLAGNIYLNMTIAGVLEFFAYVMTQFVISTPLGRKFTTSLLYLLTGMSLLSTLAVPLDMPLVVTGLLTFGRFCSCSMYNCIYIWTAELMPTGLRSSAISTVSFCGKIGAVLVPFVEHLGKLHPAMPKITIGACSVVCGLCMLLLPETKGKPLPQLIADIRPTKEKLATHSEHPGDEMAEPVHV